MLSSREWLWVTGAYHQIAVGGSGNGEGANPLSPFNVKVAAVDVDLAPLLEPTDEEQEESVGVWISVGGARKMVSVSAVQQRGPGSQQQLTWPSGKVSLWTAATGGSMLSGNSINLSAAQGYTYYAQGEVASGSVRDSEFLLSYVNVDGTAQDKVKLTVAGAEIGAFDTILVSATNDVSVELSPTSPGTNIALQIECLGGSGNAQFAPSGGASSNITQSATVKIKGVAASSTVSNMMFRVMLGSDVLATNRFTVVGLQEPMQYRIGTNALANMPDPLYVAKDTAVDFKAVKSPTNCTWPSGKPVWGGVLSGSGMESNSYTFSTVSTNATDYKIVSAECGNTVTGKVR